MAGMEMPMVCSIEAIERERAKRHSSTAHQPLRRETTMAWILHQHSNCCTLMMIDGRAGFACQKVTRKKMTDRQTGRQAGRSRTLRTDAT